MRPVRRTARRAASLLGLLAACTPDPPPVARLLPEISVVPEEVDFGDRAVPLTVTTEVVIANGGRAPLELVATLEDDAGVFAIDTEEATISKGEQAPLVLSFTPPTYLDYTAELVITSNDEDSPEVRVPIRGRGVAAPTPDIDVSTLSIDFGATADTSSQIVTVRNAGDAPLVLGDVLRAGSASFTLLTDVSGHTLAPGDDFPLVVQYAPTSQDGDSGALTLPSNDPDEPSVDVLLLGNGGADYDYPVAEIDCPGAPVDPPRMVPLDGDGSHDPEGHEPLTYTWTLVSKPETAGGASLSDAYLTNLVGPDTELWADAVGVYEVQLVVENAVGVRSAPARCTITAKPAEDVLVELTWSTTRADLDLHLAEGDASLFEKPGDVSWCNRTADWGAVGAGDDPRLDLDDRAGLGPENISIPSPAAGTYDVRVHYFDDHGDDVVTATVRVYLNGEIEPALEASRNLQRNQVWDVAHVRWPEATAAPLPGDLYSTPRRTCF